MTEAEWMSGKHPYDLIYHPRCRDDRRRRLFACACARRVLPFLTDERFAAVLDECEAFADGLIGWKDMLAVGKRLRQAGRELRAADGSEYRNHAAAAVGAVTAKEFMHFKMAVESAAAAHASRARPNWDTGRDRETAAQVALARDIFGNPFRPVAPDPTWQTDTAVSLARGMYEARDFAAMPVLADALQDAGCENADVLSHCRHPQGVHVRGCWVVDLVLGRG